MSLKYRIYKQLANITNYLGEYFNSVWYDYPFGRKPKASLNHYLKLAEEASQIIYPEVDKFESQTGYTIQYDWFNKLALHTQIVVKESSLCYAHGRILYSTLSHYLEKHPPNDPYDSVTIWETGTARGFSALCMAKALADQKRSGVIITFDLLPNDKKMFWNCIDDLDGPKTRYQLLSPWKTLVDNFIIFQQGDTKIGLPRVKSGRINFAFLDGSHNYEDVLFEFRQIGDYQLSGDIIVFDDYTPNIFPGLVKAVDEICESHDYKRTDIKGNSERGYVIAIKN